MNRSELPEWPGAACAVQVWQCPCGGVAIDEHGGLRCETCGRLFSDKGARVMDDEDRENLDAGYGPDDDLDLGWPGAVRPVPATLDD